MKFKGKSKSSSYKQKRNSTSSTRRIVSPTDIDTREDSWVETSPRPQTTDKHSSRGTSAASGLILD